MTTKTNPNDYSNVVRRSKHLTQIMRDINRVEKRLEEANTTVSFVYDGESLEVNGGDGGAVESDITTDYPTGPNLFLYLASSVTLTSLFQYDEDTIYFLSAITATSGMPTTFEVNRYSISGNSSVLVVPSASTLAYTAGSFSTGSGAGPASIFVDSTYVYVFWIVSVSFTIGGLPKFDLYPFMQRYSVSTGGFVDETYLGYGGDTTLDYEEGLLADVQTLNASESTLFVSVGSDNKLIGADLKDGRFFVLLLLKARYLVCVRGDTGDTVDQDSSWLEDNGSGNSWVYKGVASSVSGDGTHAGDIKTGGFFSATNNSIVHVRNNNKTVSGATLQAVRRSYVDGAVEATYNVGTSLWDTTGATDITVWVAYRTPSLNGRILLYRNRNVNTGATYYDSVYFLNLTGSAVEFSFVELGLSSFFTRGAASAPLVHIVTMDGDGVVYLWEPSTSFSPTTEDGCRFEPDSLPSADFDTFVNQDQHPTQSAISGKQTEWKLHLTDGSYQSAGIPDGGLHVPALDALYAGVPANALVNNQKYLPDPWRYVVDVRKAIRRLADQNANFPSLQIVNPATSSPFNFTPGDTTNNLYYTAMTGKMPHYGLAEPPGTGWYRPHLANTRINEYMDIDVGELRVITDLLMKETGVE